jgi:hypothetical protein
MIAPASAYSCGPSNGREAFAAAFAIFRKAAGDTDADSDMGAAVATAGPRMSKSDERTQQDAQ